MSVVGFDIGSQSCYVAVARHGGVEMVNNEYSDRASPTIVGLGEKRRSMGTSARNQMVTNPKNTVWGFKHFLGRSFSDPLVQREKQNLPYEIVETGKDNIGIHVTSGGDTAQTLAPEQVLAVLLTYLKKIAENSLKKPVADCVISVPSFYTDRQRRAVIDASIIAGLTCLRLMNDTTAAALAYGIYKQDLPAENEKPRNVAFVDAGHTSLQVAICSFQKGKLKVLSKAFDPELGGCDFTGRLVTHFRQDFSKRYKLSSLHKPRPTLRLFNECEKLKKNLSANSTSIPINIDCLAEDKDVSGRMNREEFVQLCEDLLKRVRTPLELALSKSGLKVEDIEAVEVVGGSCRVPSIKDIISDVFKKELSTTLNMDEAVARGCALQCAMLSPTFKVRDFSITDIQPYPIKLQWQTFIEGESGEMVVFKEGDAIYHSKILSFYRKQPFDLVATYQIPSLLPQPGSDIGTFSVKDVKPNEAGDASKIKVKVRMSIHGTFFVKTASLVEKLPVSEEEAMETDKPATAPAASTEGNGNDSSENSEGSDKQPPQAPPQESQSNQDTPMEGGGADEQTDTAAPPATDGTPSEPGSQTTPPEQQQEQQQQEQEAPPTTDDKGVESGKQSTGAAAPEKETKKAKKPTFRSMELPISESTTSLSKKQLDDLREKEVNMNYQDELEQKKIDAKNAVEEYVYEMRDKLIESLAEFVTETEKEKFSQELSATEDWLYEEGEDQSKKVYVKRLEELQKTGNRLVTRETEWRERPRAFEELASTIIHYEKILEQYRDQTNETYRHIEEEEMKKVEEAVNTKRAWMNTKQHACDVATKTTDPSVKCSEIRAEKSNLVSSCKPIVTKPKPKPKEEPPKDAEKEGEEGGGGGGGKVEEEEEKKEKGGGEEKMEEVEETQSKEKEAAEDMELD